MPMLRTHEIFRCFVGLFGVRRVDRGGHREGCPTGRITVVIDRRHGIVRRARGQVLHSVEALSRTAARPE